MKRHRRLIIFFCFLLLLAFIALNAPGFLIYATDYKKTDAVIILLGPDFKARQKEANALIKRGMADYLIIPAYHKAYGILAESKEKKLIPYLNSPGFNNNKVSSYPTFYEDTHIEIIEAQKVMSFLGLTSAIFVSSPYHMRRVKLIAGKVFDVGKGDLYFVPTRYEKAPKNFWELSSVEWRKVRREYSKIIWFYLYTTWSQYHCVDS